MKHTPFGFSLLAALLYTALAGAEPLGLPPVNIPADNPQSPDKIALGKKLFEDKRFSSTGEVSCSTCHDPVKAFTDSPLPTSKGIHDATGTRNAPTVLNAAYFKRQFWDGRSPSLEDQAIHPFVNPIEMGLPNHEPILKIVRSDPQYAKAFKTVFGTAGEAITLTEVTRAIASFERTVLSGDSPFDRYYFGGNQDALSPAAARGFQVFLGQGRCVSCHVIEQTQALFTDHRFHNIGVGINRIQDDVPRLAGAFLEAKARGADVDVTVLSDRKSSELGRFAITDQFDELGAFKTPTLREVARTAPYMHDGSLKTLREVVEHYNNGGVSDTKTRVNDFLSGGIRPLALSEQQKSDLVAFLEALSSGPSQESAKSAKTPRSKRP
ncbi:cytochrome-c peroxidase [Methylococcus sp. EFPC2]|uniref:cytochrome-c peroxidase n=1 Tax=Methylococcus sp. EFPC2 TaxID=2812648 RepID=UPI001967E900|nr:cytochrome c peroxidase [Methylococcus sp. EFPC2]QSA98741.1 cytochrome-c peroxidase [Methylococcus sp. EFPC2]